MLSTPDVDFEGGIFQTLEPDGELMAHTFQRGDVQIFQSRTAASRPSRQGLVTSW